MAVSTLHTRARSVKSASRKPAAKPATFLPWSGEVGNFLMGLKLSGAELARITDHLNLTGPESVPVLSPADAERLARIINRDRPAAYSPPAWVKPAGAFLASLGLDGLRLAEICRHIDRHKTARNVPVLNGVDATALQQIIDGYTPDASTDEAPRPEGSPEPTDADWREYSRWSRSLEASAPLRSEVGSYRHPARMQVVPDWTDADQLRQHGCV